MGGMRGRVKPQGSAQLCVAFLLGVAVTLFTTRLSRRGALTTAGRPKVRNEKAFVLSVELQCGCCVQTSPSPQAMSRR